MLDRATLEVGLLAVMEEELGQVADRTDFLSISFSQTDRVGHAYGPLSREQMDNLLRLDQVLGELFSFLDQVVGQEDYVVGLTGDHGVMNMPERMEPRGTRLSSTKKSELEYTISRAAREANARGDSTTAPAMLRAIRELPYIGPSYTQKQLSAGEPADSFLPLFQHSYTPGRAGGLLSIYGIEMWWAEGVLSWGLPVGTTHGSPFYYDRWVPLIVMGPGIEGGRSSESVKPLDLAPTLAELAGIPFPDDLDGRPLKRKPN
jgi:predicted AlkP superfamily pyrophosphatase or phosphodiesterase